MKIAIAADIHCGYKDRLSDCISSLSAIRDHAKNNSIDVVVILGDLFHDRTNLNIKVVSDVADFLDETKFKYGQEWMVFPGNHDMFMRHAWTVNSLRPIKRLITLIDDVAHIKIGGRGFRIIPFIQREESYMKVLEYVNTKSNDNDILLTHIGVCGASKNICFLLQHWGVVNFDNTKFNHVFAGHFHCNQDIGKVHIPGSPLAFRFDEGMVDHGFYEFDLDSDTPKFIPIKSFGGKPPPDFITVSESDIDSINPSNSSIRVLLDNEKSRDELERIKHNLESHGAIKVTWMKSKSTEQDSKATDNVVSDSSSLLEKYVQHDNPDNINQKLLLSLNKQIIDEAYNIESESNAIDE